MSPPARCLDFEGTRHRGRRSLVAAAWRRCNSAGSMESLPPEPGPAPSHDAMELAWIETSMREQNKLWLAETQRCPTSQVEPGEPSFELQI